MYGKSKFYRKFLYKSVNIAGDFIFTHQSNNMQQITDEYMQEMLTKTKTYTLMLLKPGPNVQREDVKQIIWEHGRNNFKLRAEGLLSIVCPVALESEVVGIGIFNADADVVHDRLKEDPAIQAGIFIYELLPVRGFPGDCLPS
jgi:hypothetical protein